MSPINFWEWLSRIDPNNTQMVLFGTGGLAWFVIENVRNNRQNRSEKIGSAEEQEAAVKQVKSPRVDQENRDMSMEAVSAAFRALSRADRLEEQITELMSKFETISKERDIQEVWIRDVKHNWHIYRRKTDPPTGPIFPDN